MAAVGVPPVMVGVAKRLFYVLSVCPIADNTVIQQVVFVVFCTIIFLSGLSFRYLYIQPLIRLSVARYNRLFNSMFGSDIIRFALQSIMEIRNISGIDWYCVICQFVDYSNNRLYNGLFLHSIISLSDLLTDKLFHYLVKPACVHTIIILFVRCEV
jgi:hypothetical protein